MPTGVRRMCGLFGNRPTELEANNGLFESRDWEEVVFYLKVTLLFWNSTSL
jgi:hypothetical protein